MRRKDLIRKRICWKDQLAGGRTAYILWRFVASDPYLEFKHQSFVYFASEKANIIDDHIEPGRPNYQSEEFIEINLIEEWKEAQPFFLNVCLSTKIKRALLSLLKEFKDQAHPAPELTSQHVPIKKKNGQICCCINFHNLNEACRKMSFHCQT